MNPTEILVYTTREGRHRARVRNEHGTAHTAAYSRPHGMWFEVEHIMDGVSTSEGSPCLNPEATTAHNIPAEQENP